MSEDYESSLFDSSYPADLKDIIPDGHVWPKLHTLRLGCFETLQDDLMRFLHNHKDTLKKLILIDVALDFKWYDNQITGAGSWMNLLPNIRNTLILDYGCLHGEICTRGVAPEEDEEWHVSHEDFEGDEDLQGIKSDPRMKALIEKYKLE